MSIKPSRSNSLSVTRSEPSKSTPVSELTNTSVVPKEIISVIDSLKQHVEAQRQVYVKNIMEENRQKLCKVTLGKERKNVTPNDLEKNAALLVKRQTDAVNMQNGIGTSTDGDGGNVSPEDTAILLGSPFPNKNTIRAIRIPGVKRLPPYTTWIFLDRNQRMTEDQSVVGRRRIYYDPNGGEALICSDSEEEVIEDEEDKKDFVRSEDYILRMTVKEVGLSDAVLDLLGQCFSKKPSDIKARYEILCEEEKAMAGVRNGDTMETSENSNPYLDKDLEGALDSFDNLFCRRCYVFDCRLHGCSQDLIFPTEKHPWSSSEEANVPCGLHCYRTAPKCEGDSAVISQKFYGSEAKPGPSSDDGFAGVSPRKKSIGSSNKRKGKSTQSESASSHARNTSDSSDSDENLFQDNNSVNQSSIHSKGKLIGKSGARKSRNKRAAEKIVVAIQKRHKKIVAQDADSVNAGPSLSRDMKLRSRARKEDNVASFSHKKGNLSTGERSRKASPAVGSSKSNCETPSDLLNVASNDQSTCHLDDVSKKEELVDESPGKLEVNNDSSWKALEKALYEKGLEIFGRNSCLIARNLLNGLKTCSEVYQYMNHLNNNLSYQGGDDGTNLDCTETMGNDIRRRSRYVRRRGRVRRLKYTWKSTGYHSIRKRISERKDQPCRQYNPCGCESYCGKQCSCLLNGTCCEKYCGCPKNCKNRFRGCHCAKSQCRSRQCPCFAADRECDPDVCRNCWVSCGDGTLGVPNQRGDNYGCRNMKLLLKQQQRVLLGRSDVSGWGAFLKNGVGKHEYLGEYTGELISHREADKRGKIYDRENSSFLFNLNDQFVLDAYRKGDKLKFANHSPDPNCYAKVIMVAGDHRVGIFAKERINAGEELFYDYRYEPDRAPAWARKPEEPGSKKDAAGPSNGRAKKLA
ncbi:histone-lysine N-methyltransferase CLF-like isoform X1 [Chenopodium quinoa]|uniref:histone-lysine N-methyltransferase CLF-like isoform X1 n=1 Tax=Chenopodium quinoa TaxID=63459 RepID=UPI000B787BCF|nr:histone-lysine N-methyltransferase CLF-like isoform X1 [Chenopodium quinoa]